jgi:hypothetical protein
MDNNAENGFYIHRDRSVVFINLMILMSQYNCGIYFKLIFRGNDDSVFPGAAIILS